MRKLPAAKSGNKNDSRLKIRREGPFQRPIRFSRHLLSAGGLLCFGFLGGCGDKFSIQTAVDARIDVSPDKNSVLDTSKGTDPDAGSALDTQVEQETIDAEEDSALDTPEDTGRDADSALDKETDSDMDAALDTQVEADNAQPEGGGAELADSSVEVDAPGPDVTEMLDIATVPVGLDTSQDTEEADGADGSDGADTGEDVIADGGDDGTNNDGADTASGADTSDVAPDSIQPSRPPNILVIVADDFGYSDIHAFGSEIETPNLDALVGNGRILTNFHTGSVSAVTRSMLISGTDHHLVGLGSQFYEKDERMGLPGYEGYLNEHSLSIADLLQDAGYHTYIAGKWHLGYGVPTHPEKPGKTPDQWGFEKSYTLLGAAAMNHFGHEAAGSMNYSENGEYMQPGQPGQPGGEGGSPREFFSTNFYTQKLIEYIDSNHGPGKDNKPFFVYAAYTAAHTPLQVPEPWLSQYKGVYKDGYQPIREARMRRMKDLGIVPPDAVMYAGAAETKTQSPATANWDVAKKEKAITASHSADDGYVDYHEGVVNKKWNSLTEKEQKAQQRYMEIFAGMVSNLDYNVGLLIQHLKDIGEYDRTFIIFHSDNGPEGIASGKGADPKSYDEANAVESVYKTLGKDSGQQRADPFIMYGLRWAEVSATPFAQVKAYLGEGSTSVPAIVKLPGQTGPLPPLSVYTHVIDEAATFLALAGVAPPSEPAPVKKDAGAGPTQRMVVYRGRNVFPITGQSLLPLLKGESAEIVRTEGQFGDEIYGRACIYSKDFRWKARWTEPPIGPFDGHWELFDLNSDRGETTDISAQYLNFMDTLFGQWQDYMTKVGGVEPVHPNGYF
jgi:arylsulfatase A-like enzyme